MLITLKSSLCFIFENECQNLNYKYYCVCKNVLLVLQNSFKFLVRVYGDRSWLHDYRLIHPANGLGA